MTHPLVSSVRSALQTAADPERAPAMAAYMKSAMPFLGVRRPEVRRLARAQAHAYPPADLHALAGAARELWDTAEFREERYAAQDLLGLPQARGAGDLLPLHRHMAVTGAWWDHVDEIAHRRSARRAPR